MCLRRGAYLDSNHEKGTFKIEVWLLFVDFIDWCEGFKLLINPDSEKLVNTPIKSRIFYARLQRYCVEKCSFRWAAIFGTRYVFMTLKKSSMALMTSSF